jgi:hypothetical protein
MKRMIARISVLGALLASPLALTVPAHASTPADQAVAACGAGYYVQDSEPIGYADDATAFLLYNTSTGNNCAVTVKSSDYQFYGEPTGLGAGIIKSGGSWTKDDGDYKYYAGPVYVHAAGSCVQFWAHIEEISTTTVRNFYYTSPWEHCA